MERLLTQHNELIAAASINDGLDAGYLQYVIYSRANPYLALMSENINGGIPFGAGLGTWFQNSPAFN